MKKLHPFPWKKENGAIYDKNDCLVATCNLRIVGSWENSIKILNQTSEFIVNACNNSENILEATKNKPLKIKSREFTGIMKIPAWEMWAVKARPEEMRNLTDLRLVVSDIEALLMNLHDIFLQCQPSKENQNEKDKHSPKASPSPKPSRRV